MLKTIISPEWENCGKTILAIYHQSKYKRKLQKFHLMNAPKNDQLSGSLWWGVESTRKKSTIFGCTFHKNCESKNCFLPY